MRLKMLTGLCGPAISLVRNDPHSPESDHEAIRLIDAGFAVAEDPDEEAKIRPIVEAEWAAADASVKAAIDDAIDNGVLVSKEAAAADADAKIEAAAQAVSEQKPAEPKKTGQAAKK